MFRRMLNASVWGIFFLGSTILFAVEDSTHIDLLRSVIEEEKAELRHQCHRTRHLNISTRQRCEERSKLLTATEKSLCAGEWNMMLKKSIQGGFEDLVTRSLAILHASRHPLATDTLTDALQHDAAFPEEAALYPLISPQVKATLSPPKFARAVAMELSGSPHRLSDSFLDSIASSVPKKHQSEMQEARDKDGNTSLMRAASANQRNLLLRELSHAGPEVLLIRNRFGWQLLHIAAAFCDADCIEAIVRKLPDVQSCLRQRVQSYVLNRRCFPYELLATNEHLSHDERQHLVDLLRPRKESPTSHLVDAKL